MVKQVSLVALIILVVFFFNPCWLVAQEIGQPNDTFFLSKKKGLLGKLGKSISRDIPAPDPIKLANPYVIHAGKSVRTIYVTSLGFERNMYDTTKIKNTFGSVIANAFHKNTGHKIITNNLFFKEGSKINPYLIADNERHLREQVYLQDARIILVAVPGSTDLVDVFVITKDVFSIGGNLNFSGVDRAQVEVKEENFAGSGSKIAVSSFYERQRRPNFGYGFDIIARNMKGSFINWSLGYQTYKSAFNSGRSEESFIYTRFEKPLITPYVRWVGAADISYSKTYNAYLKDSLYLSDFKYSYLNTDAWFGYNIGSRKLIFTDANNRLRKFVSLRAIHLRFDQLPQINRTSYDYRYADISGILIAFSAFKQNFYRTSFIYGFGRNEDVPEGFTASLITGLTNKIGRTRSYYGIDVQRSHFNKKGFYSTYIFKFGSYAFKNVWEDIDLLLSVDHFTRLKNMNSKWYNRFFYSASFTKQIRPVLNQPLYLHSMFGLPYYDNTNIVADFRGTIKGEAVFYNMHKIWGFRIAPFIFSDLSLITPVNRTFDKSNLYSAVGAGVRTRNENLVFGTIELKGYFFPTPIGYMKNYKIEINTNIRFKYNNAFNLKPDFVVPN